MVEQDSAVPVLNMGAALERMGGDEELYHEIKAVFLEDAAVQLKSLAEVLATEDRSEIQRIAHSLKSASGSVGGEAMQASAKRLEDAAPSETLTGLESMFESLCAEFERLQSELQQ